ncbi:uncharacterized protein LOC115889972 isoform X2 [Sitophilus oryzae]|uniref:Uncharacterized protein LOC115889972 isoform X2 n=1 Tax=Sitophilus oryzae TaxID=7048 RepID=A0A6J2YRL8_SITOR|nr:uncharacterized protein LOC115889972 isoform X2 [Sitophilus oryzae]
MSSMPPVGEPYQTYAGQNPPQGLNLSFEDVSNYNSFMESLVTLLNEAAACMQQVRERAGIASGCSSPVKMSEDDKKLKMNEILQALSVSFLNASAPTLSTAQLRQPGQNLRCNLKDGCHCRACTDPYASSGLYPPERLQSVQPLQPGQPPGSFTTFPRPGGSRILAPAMPPGSQHRVTPPASSASFNRGILRGGIVDGTLLGIDGMVEPETTTKLHIDVEALPGFGKGLLGLGIEALGGGKGRGGRPPDLGSRANVILGGDKGTNSIQNLGVTAKGYGTQVVKDGGSASHEVVNMIHDLGIEVIEEAAAAASRVNRGIDAMNKYGANIGKAVHGIGTVGSNFGIERTIEIGANSGMGGYRGPRRGPCKYSKTCARI